MIKLLQNRAERNLSEISADEVEMIKKEIGLVVDEIKSLGLKEARDKLVNLRFGSTKNTILHLAAKFDHVQAIADILSIANKDKIIIDAKNSHYLSAMHFVAMDGDLEVAKMLLDAGIDKNSKTSNQKREWAPIHYAARHNNLKIIELLLNRGVDKEVKTLFGLTPLIIAAEFGHLDLVDFLLSKGADKNAKTFEDNDMMTSLHYAAVDGHFEIVDHLLKAGVARNSETSSGLSALDFAARIDHVKIANLLLSWGVGDLDRAFEIAKNSKSDKVIKLIERYIAARDKIMSKKWLSLNESDFVSVLKGFSLVNIGEINFKYDDTVSFNAYGILSLKKSFGLFKKQTKSLKDICFENEFFATLGEIDRLTSISK